MNKIIEKLSNDTKQDIKKFVEEYGQKSYDRNTQAKGYELFALAVNEMNESSNKNKELRELRLKEMEKGEVFLFEFQAILDKYKQEIESLIIIQQLEDCLYKKHLEGKQIK